MEQEALRQEMVAVMKQLSLPKQRQLLELALAFRRAENGLPPSLEKDEDRKNDF